MCFAIRKKKQLCLSSCTSGHSQSECAVVALRSVTEPGEVGEVEVNEVGEICEESEVGKVSDIVEVGVIGEG